MTRHNRHPLRLGRRHGVRTHQRPRQDKARQDVCCGWHLLTNSRAGLKHVPPSSPRWLAGFCSSLTSLSFFCPRPPTDRVRLISPHPHTTLSRPPPPELRLPPLGARSELTRPGTRKETCILTYNQKGRPWSVLVLGTTISHTDHYHWYWLGPADANLCYVCHRNTSQNTPACRPSYEIQLSCLLACLPARPEEKKRDTRKQASQPTTTSIITSS